MTDAMRSWWRENHTLIIFLGAQALALGAAATAVIAYSVKLETRVSIMETRGAEYTVARMEEMKLKIAVLENDIKENKVRIDRITEIMLRELPLKKDGTPR